MSVRNSSFAPVTDARTRVLILGSLPGMASLAAGRYYAHPQNQFWRLVGALLDRDLVGLDYDDRLAALRHAGIGLWDTVADAVRPGSLDAAIRDARGNDVAALAAGLPELRAVGLNGATAAKLGRRAFGEAPRWPLLALPSSSPAHAGMTFDAKRDRWLALRDWLG